MNQKATSGDRNITPRFLWVYDFGRISFTETWELQKELVNRRVENVIPDVLLLVEHPDVLTCGKALLSPGADLKKISGLPFHFVERGGSETYHGPGQVVGYPIMKLADRERDVHKYMRNLEEVIIRSVEDLGLPAQRVKGYTGVWVNGKKIASIGIAVRKWVTYHGFAINVNTDLSKYQMIKPCGLEPDQMSSVSELLQRTISRTDVMELCLKHMGDVFGRVIIPSDEPL